MGTSLDYVYLTHESLKNKTFSEALKVLDENIKKLNINDCKYLIECEAFLDIFDNQEKNNTFFMVLLSHIICVAEIEKVKFIKIYDATDEELYNTFSRVFNCSDNLKNKIKYVNTNTNTKNLEF